MEVIIILLILPLLAGAGTKVEKSPASLALGVVILFLICFVFACVTTSYRH